MVHLKVNNCNNVLLIVMGAKSIQKVSISMVTIELCMNLQMVNLILLSNWLAIMDKIGNLPNYET